MSYSPAGSALVTYDDTMRAATTCDSPGFATACDERYGGVANKPPTYDFSTTDDMITFRDADGCGFQYRRSG